DDVQFFAGKEKTQDEFFHTFNELINSQKQIVLSCDRPPAEIGGLEQRLVSRFEWGLTAEIIAPDMETRLAILRRKAEVLPGVRVPDDALEFVAQRVKANVRRLEGALTRIATHLSLNPGDVSSERLEILLRDILQEEARRVLTIDQIQRVVVEHYDLRQADMTSKRRPAAIAFPRQVAMYLSRELTKASLNEIGDAFGGRDHGTVLHAHKLVKMRLKEDEKLRHVLRSLEQKLER
ncbi:MAG: chromosomal replication initiator protein DnaA, partial [Verrucomicrobia bacterium]|nr:chromosomal replication initiator protein DnaA [Verrucomicrobiota bacterium]